MKLNVQQYHNLRNCIFEDLVACGVTDNSDENFKAFDEVLGSKLDVDWEDDGKTSSNITISTFTNDTVECRAYFNDDLDNGVEIWDEGAYVGKMVGENIPDEEDEEEVEKFTKTVEDWLIDNGY